MIDLAAILEQIGQDLAEQRAQWALVGGLAVSARTEPRFTRDVDIAVSVGSDAEAERIVATLARSGWLLLATVEQEATGRLAAVRLRLATDSPPGRVVDLLFASSGIEAELVAQADELEVLPGTRTRVARVGHLIALKALARAASRPQDEADLAMLVAAAGPEDLRLAVEAARVIEARGYARGKRLSSEIEAMNPGRGT